MKKLYFLKSQFSVQYLKITRWYLSGVTSYGAISDSKLQKNPKLKQRFGVLASDRVSVPTKILLVIIIYKIPIKLLISTTLVMEK